MILSDPNPVVIKRYIDKRSDGTVYVGDPTVEASAADLSAFVINVGGDDYYASEESFDVEQAATLRDLLNTWLVQQDEA
jgi:hypothetical protein